MVRRVILAMVVLLLLAGSLIIALEADSKSLSNNYEYTRAYCDAQNRCFDYLIECNEHVLTGLKKIYGVVQHNSDWKDPRGKLGLMESDRLCLLS